MPTSSSKKERRIAMANFDSYCRTVMRHYFVQSNKITNTYRENEVTVGMEVLEYVSDKYGQKDIYPAAGVNFNPELPIRVNVDHILGDYENLERIPEKIRKAKNLPLSGKAYLKILFLYIF